MRKWTKAQTRRVAIVAGVAVLVVSIAFGLSQLGARPAEQAAVPVEAVERRDIVQTVEATGTVEPVDVVEIKSKASGQIVRMPVEVGDRVAAGDLLAQIDPLTVRNQYDQALAAERSAAAQLQIANAQKERADQLLAREVIAKVEHENAVLAVAAARAALAKARADLAIARQTRSDATVRAPSAGTIIEQTATQGMVITSATSSASGGTTLLKMADLSRIEMRTMVSESDVGALQAGMPAKVVVDAFPNRSFDGHVVRVEPQAVVEQSVTMFPVRVAIDNEGGVLLPGMNGEVTIEISRQAQAVAVPLDALRGVRELPAVAEALGLDARKLQAKLPRASAGEGRGRGRGRQQFALVQTANGLVPRLVRTGVSDYDHAQVLEGLQVGESVALLSVAEQSAERAQRRARMASRMGSGLTGATGGSRGAGSGTGTGGSGRGTGGSGSGGGGGNR
jgi:HlyD family secretion protein